MAEECTHNCESCSADCASRSKNGNTGKESLLIPANPASEVKHIIGVVSGKGGVGKSLVTSMLAVLLRREGFRVGIMDADITGPSIPKAFGVHNVRIYDDDNGMIPPATTTGIDMISVNLLLGEDETRPVIWRGALLVKPFSETFLLPLYLFLRPNSRYKIVSFQSGSRIFSSRKQNRNGIIVAFAQHSRTDDIRPADSFFLLSPFFQIFLPPLGWRHADRLAEHLVKMP